MNEVIFRDEQFYVSYLEQRSELGKALDDICHVFGRPKPQDRSETALCVREDKQGRTRFLILYDDHREAYRKLIPDLQACLKYFNDNINLISHSSDTPNATQN